MSNVKCLFIVVMHLATQAHELSNAFNDHFSSIGLKLANNIHANEDNSSHWII